MSKVQELTPAQAEAFRRVVGFVKFATVPGKELSDAVVGKKLGGLKQQNINRILKGGGSSLATVNLAAEASGLIDITLFMKGRPGEAIDERVRAWLPPPEFTRDLATTPEPDGEDTDTVKDALAAYPSFSKLERYGAEHALAARILERVDHYPDIVAEALVWQAKTLAFDEEATPTLPLRALQIAQTARDFDKKSPAKAPQLHSLPKKKPR